MDGEVWIEKRRGAEPQGLCDEYAAVRMVLGKNREIPEDYL